jgi:hypothetical protein
MSTSRMQIIGHYYARSKEDVIFYDGELGYVDVGMDLDTVPHAATIVNDRVSPNAHVVTDRILFPNYDVVSRLKVTPDL